MSDIKFKFSDDKQRELNIGKEIDPVQQKRRKVGRHYRTLKVHIDNKQFRRLLKDKPEGIQIYVFPVRDAHGNNIPPSEPEWWTTKGLAMVLFCSENNPLPWCRYNEYDLDEIITELFADYRITEENLKESEYPGIEDLIFTHLTVLETNTATGKDELNKHTFNVTTQEVKESDIDYINEKYKLFGYKLNKKDALKMADNKTINTERKFIYEVGEV